MLKWDVPEVHLFPYRHMKFHWQLEVFGVSEMGGKFIALLLKGVVLFVFVFGKVTNMFLD